MVVNNIVGKAVKNNRQSIRQRDKFSMELFSFGMDPILDYLERRLTGILIHSTPVQGPVQVPAPRNVQYGPPPDVPGLPPLPRPPPRPPSTLLQRYGRQLLPTLETRYILYAYWDDLKPAITNLWEFHLVERIMTIFEKASGCTMHRSAASNKCKFLALGKWRNDLT